MELELGLKITRTREDVSSSVDFRFSKDPFGPLLLSRETDSRFIVIIHLKGFKKEGIEIEINKEGNRITIRGRKPVEEMVLVRWMAWKKEVELRAFRKVFRIPDIVDLDKIKARFDEDDATLTITMPKRVKGISGFKIEEEEEEERVDFGDVSEVDNREELESIGREESDEHLEKFEESHGEEFGDMMEKKEIVNEVLEDDEKGFSGDLEEEEETSTEIDEGVTGQEEIEEVKKGKTAETNAKTEHDGKIHQTEEQGWSEPQRSKKEEEEEEDIVGQKRLEEQEMVTSITESEDSGLRKLPDIEGRESHEQTRHDEEQEKLNAFDKLEADGLVDKREEEEEIGKDGTKSEDSSKLQENEEKQEMIKELVEEKTSEADTKIVNDTKKPVQEIEEPEVDGSERHEGKDKIKEKEKDGAIEYKMYDDDGSSKIQGLEEQESVKLERHKEESKTQEMVEGETSDQGKGGEEKKRIVKKETENDDVDLKTGEGVTENIERRQVQGEEVIAETETKIEADTSQKWHEFDKPEASDIDKIHELVKEEMSNEEEKEKHGVGPKSEGSSLVKLEEIEEQQPKGQKPHDKEEIGREVSDEHLEKFEESHGEEFEEMMEKKEIENEVSEDDEKGFSGDLEEEEETSAEIDGVTGQEEIEEVKKVKTAKSDAKTEHDGKIHQTEEQGWSEPQRSKKEGEEEKETVGKKRLEEQEMVTSNTESEDSGLRKLPDTEGRESHEQTRHDEEQENNQELVEQDVYEAETKSDEIGSQAFEENEQQEPDERASESREEKEKFGATEKSMNDDDDDDDDDSSKVQESVEGERGDQGKGVEDVIEEVDAKMGVNENIERTQVQVEADGDVSEKLNEFDKLEVDELVDKREEDEAFGKGGTKSEDNSLTKLQENEEKEATIKELVEEKTSEAETKVVNDTKKPVVQEIEEPEVDRSERHEGKEKIKEKEKGGAIEYKMYDDDGSSKIQGFEQDSVKLERHKEESKTQEMVEGETSDQGKGEEEKKRIVEKEEENEISKEYVDLKTGVGVTENIERRQVQGEEVIAETETKTEADTSEKWHEFDKPETSEIDKIHELVEEEMTNEEEEEKHGVGPKSEGSSLLKLEEIDEQQPKGQKPHDKEEKVKELMIEQQILDAEVKNDTPKKGQEIVLPEEDKVERYEGKHKIQDLVEEKTNFCEEEKLKEEEETAEKETKGKDDISREVRDTEQRDSNAVKEEKVCDEGNGGISVTETVAENDKSKKVQEIDKQQSHELDTCEKQAKTQKLNGGEVSGRGEDQDNVKKESNASGKSDIGDTIQAHCRDEQEKNTNYKAETRGIVANTGDLNSQLKQDNIEDREKTQELVEKKTKDCEEEEVRKDKDSEEPKTENDDDVLRKVQGIEEHEVYEPKRHPLSEMQELVEKKTGEKEEDKEMTESEIVAEYNSLRKVPDIEEQELPERDKHKERDKFRMAGEKEPIGQENEEVEKEKIIESGTITEDDDSLNVKEAKEEQSDKPESHEKRYKIQELVEKGHNDHKEEQQEEKIIPKAELEPVGSNAKKAQEIGKQEYDESKRYMVQEKIQEIGRKDKTGVKVEKETVEGGTKSKDGSLSKVQDEEDLGLGKPKGRRDEYKIHELVETGRSGYVEAIKRKDEDDILGSQEVGRPDVDEFEIQGEQSNNPQSVEEKMENIAKPKVKMEYDSSVKSHMLEEQESYEDWTQEEKEKIENLVKEEVIDLGVKHTVGEVGNEKEKYEKVTETKTKVEDDIYEKVSENDDPELGIKKRYKQLEKLEGLLEERASDQKKEEVDLMDNFTGKIQETESERHRKLDIVQEIMEDKRGDQEDEEVEEAATIITKNEEAVHDNLKPVHDIKEPNVDISERHESKYEIQELNQVETSGHQEEKKEKLIETGEKSSDIGVRKVQEIRQQESGEPARCVETGKTQEIVKSKINYEEEEKERIAGTEAKEREPFRPKILREQDKTQELVEEKTSFCKEEFAEKETKGEAAMSRKDVEQQDSGAIKGLQDEEDQIQELVEELCDAGKATIAVEGEVAENAKARNVQEMNEQESLEIDAFHKRVKFPELKGGEISGSGDNEERENKKMTTEADKKIMDRVRKVEEIITDESDLSGKHEKGDKMKELQEEKREHYQDGHEKEMDEKETWGLIVNTEDDGLEKIKGATEQELVDLDSQLNQENIKEREKTQELVEEKSKDCKEKEVRKDKGSKESKAKTDDDVSRKVQGIEEQVLYEQSRPLNEMQELVEEKTGEKEEEKEKTESKIEAECGSLRTEHGNEEQELHEPNIHKEQDKIQIAEAEEPIRQEKEEDKKEKTGAEPEIIMENKSPTNVQETKEDRPPKPERQQKQFKIEELVEAGYNDHKVKQQKEKGIPKKELEAEKDSAKNVQEIDKREFDELKRSMVIDKMQETGEEDKTRAMEEKETVQKGRETKDGSSREVRDDEDQGLGKPKRRGEEEKIQELVEMERSDYKEEVNRKDKDYNDFENNIPQLVEEENLENIAEPEEKLEVDNSGKVHEFEEGKSYEDWTDEEQEKTTNLVKEEASDPKNEHTGGGEENLVNDFIGKIQETGKEKPEDQEDEVAEEAAALVTEDKKGRSRKAQTIEELEEIEKEADQIKVEPRDREEKVEEEEQVALKETGTEVPSSSDLGKTVETMSPERFKTKIEDLVEELEGKLVTENDSTRKGDECLENEPNGSKIPKISSQHQDVEERGPYQSEKLMEQEVEEKRFEDYDDARREKRGEEAKTSKLPEDESKANDDSSSQNETEGQESTRLEGQKTKENLQEQVERETRDQRKEEKEKDVGKAKTEAEYDSSRKIHETEEQKSEGKTSDCTEETEGNRAGAVWREEETKIRDDGIEKIKEEELVTAMRYREQDKKQSMVENDKSSKAKEKKNQETLSIGDRSRVIQDIKTQEPDERKRVAEQSKNLTHVWEKTNMCRNQEEDTKEDKEITEADDTREVKEIGKRESPEIESHGDRENIKELVAEKMETQERKDKKSLITESMTKEDPESKLHERPREKHKMKELVQQKPDNLEHEETTKTETKSKDSESSKMQEIIEEETCDPGRLKEQEKIKELVADKTGQYKEKEYSKTEFEDDSLQKVQETDKEGSIQDFLDREISEDDEEELEIEFEDEEEEWEAEVIQEMDSDEDNDKIREIRRIKLGFRLVGGSALFMSLIVIVIRFIRSKKKIRTCKF